MNTNPIETPDPDVRTLINSAPGNPLCIELRGYEVAKDLGGKWEVVSRWRPNEGARQQALVAVKWLNERELTRGGVAIYALRPIVSMLAPAPEVLPTEAAVIEARVEAGAFDVSDVK